MSFQTTDCASSPLVLPPNHLLLFVADTISLNYATEAVIYEGVKCYFSKTSSIQTVRLSNKKKFKIKPKRVISWQPDRLICQ